jgi:hypothetical protein
MDNGHDFGRTYGKPVFADANNFFASHQGVFCSFLHTGPDFGCVRHELPLPEVAARQPITAEMLEALKSFKQPSSRWTDISPEMLPAIVAAGIPVREKPAPHD